MAGRGEEQMSGLETDHKKGVCRGCAVTIWVKKGEPELCGECKRRAEKKRAGK